MYYCLHGLPMWKVAGVVACAPGLHNFFKSPGRLELWKLHNHVPVSNWLTYPGKEVIVILRAVCAPVSQFQGTRWAFCEMLSLKCSRKISCCTAGIIYFLNSVHWILGIMWRIVQCLHETHMCTLSTHREIKLCYFHLHYSSAIPILYQVVLLLSIWVVGSQLHRYRSRF